jgi:predicted protein tyrosine phosphatase
MYHDRKTAYSMLMCDRFHNKKYYFISISDSDEEIEEMTLAWNDSQKSEGCQALFLKFSDVEVGVALATDEQITSIVDFVNQGLTEKVDGFFVHCLYGASRSAAVAKFINLYLGLDHIDIEEYNFHNVYLYQSLLNKVNITE